MKSVILVGLLCASALAAPDKDFGRLPVVVKVNSRGRQVVSGLQDGQVGPNGGIVRKVARRGRGNIALNPAINPAFALSTPAQPIFDLRGAPLQQFNGAPAPLQFIQFAPEPQFQLQTFSNSAPLPLLRQPQPLPFPLQPSPAPLVFLNQPRIQPSPLPAVTPTLEFGTPATVAAEVRQTIEGYGAPPAVIEVRDSYLPSDEEVIEVRDSYLPAQEVFVAEPQSVGVEVIAVRDNVLTAQPSQSIAVQRNNGANVKSDLVRARPIEILRSVYNPPAETGVFNYAFESENGIKQEATGSLRTVDDAEVSVMKGSYSYIGSDGLDYLVEWYADETGFHATAPHLPQSVLPNHPEVAAAVRAQIEFAAEEDAAAAAAERSNSFAAPERSNSYAAPERSNSYAAAQRSNSYAAPERAVVYAAVPEERLNSYSYN